MYNESVSNSQARLNEFFSLCIMAKMKSIKLFTDFISQNVQNDYGMTCLHYLSLSIAHSYKKYMLLKYLLKKGANSNIVDDKGDTMLHKICYSDINQCLVPLLCKNMNNLNIVNEQLLTPFLIAAINNSSQTMIHLLKSEKTIDPNVFDKKKKSVLHYIVQHNNIDVLTLLCKTNNLNINCKDNDGYTPLHYAFAYEFLDCSRILLDNGAFVNSVDNNGNTCLHYMYNQLNDSGKQLLKKYGASNFIMNKNNEIPMSVPKKVEA